MESSNGYGVPLLPKHKCHICNQEFDQYALEVHFLSCNSFEDEILDLEESDVEKENQTVEKEINQNEKQIERSLDNIKKLPSNPCTIAISKAYAEEKNMNSYPRKIVQFLKPNQVNQLNSRKLPIQLQPNIQNANNQKIIFLNTLAQNRIQLSPKLPTRVSIITKSHQSSQVHEGQNESQVHKGQKEYHCKICNFSSSYNVNLQYHLKTVHAEKSESYTSTASFSQPEPIKIFTEKSYRIVEKKIIPSIELLVKCQFCGKYFSTKKKIEDHISTDHERQEAIQIEPSKSDSNSHPAVNILKCDLCHIYFKHKSSLTRHKTHKHYQNGKKITSSSPKTSAKVLPKLKLKCFLCHMYFVTVEELNIHSKICKEKFKPLEKIIHEEKTQPKKIPAQKFKCTFCGKQFLTEVNLNSHIFVHVLPPPQLISS